ncbi:hypothetical protein [Aliarcobacter lanthieri]|uniref:hypothetical protein n=1 Tax=Aliarcobacter lanthieri TaxID=1355374 RepID=UPI00047AACD1|nr:hypothetical protein [Aliarcobacter lanthieri]QKF59290.1 hypothetical protein ALANTH_1181 [Aliarcobacter lanthieri]
MNSLKFFSAKRLSSYTNEEQHKNNFILVQKITPKIGILEISTRNIVSSILGISNDTFISKQTFGFWAKIIEDEKIHNQVLNLYKISLKKYSKFNRKDKLLNYQKVKIVYNLLVMLRNRAFHFENLYKLNPSNTPRISTKVGKTIVGIDPDKIEIFIDDILDSFDENLKSYIESGG